MSCSRLTVAAALTALCLGGPVHAGIDLSWNECATSPGALPGMVLNCDGSELPPIVVSFSSPVTVSDMAGIDALIRIHADEIGALPPFWQFQFGSCTGSGLDVSDRWRTTSTSCTNPWGFLGNSSQTVIGARPVDARHIEYLVTVYSSFGATFAVTAGQHYFGFELQMYPQETGCEGCNAPVTIEGVDLTIMRTSGSPIIITSPGVGTNCISSNGGACGWCGGTECPTVPTTWSALKSLYR